ncbi:MAG: hypothetical protein RLZZ393_247, partial [Pseudomonadota bacterium]
MTIPVRLAACLVACLGLAPILQAAPAPADPRSTAAAPVLDDHYPPRRVSFAGGVTGLPDLVYAQPAGFRPLTLDVYLPPRSTARRGGNPLVVFIHGGGWVNGHTRHSGAFENWPGLLAAVAAKGYVVASLNYRLSGEAPFPAAIQDVKSAIRWLRARAAVYGIDATRAMAWGGSAGGQLAALAATSCGEPALAPAGAAEVSDCVQGAVLWYPVTDFSAMARPAGPGAPPPAENKYLGCAIALCSAETLRLASPLKQVSARTPPMLMVHGDGDRQVPVQQSIALDAALRAAGVHSELLVIPGVDHSFIGAT